MRQPSGRRRTVGLVVVVAALLVGCGAGEPRPTGDPDAGDGTGDAHDDDGAADGDGEAADARDDEDGGAVGEADDDADSRGAESRGAETDDGGEGDTDPTPEGESESQDPDRAGDPGPAPAVVHVVEGDAAPTELRWREADGEGQQVPLDGAGPGSVGLVPDGHGGVAWQPEEGQAAGDILHAAADGTVTTVVAGGGDSHWRLVGPDLAGGGVLATRTTGDGPDTRSGDLLALDPAVGKERLVAEDVVGWESGPTRVVTVDDVRLSSGVAEALEFVVLERAGAEPVTVLEGGEPTGEFVTGLTVAAGRGVGLVLVERHPPDGGRTTRLLHVDLDDGRIVDDVEVSVQRGLDDGPAPEALDVSTADEQVLVNRRDDGGRALPPLHHDLDTGAWTVFEEVEGRAVLVPVGRDA